MEQEVNRLNQIFELKKYINKENKQGYLYVLNKYNCREFIRILPKVSVNDNLNRFRLVFGSKRDEMGYLSNHDSNRESILNGEYKINEISETTAKAEKININNNNSNKLTFEILSNIFKYIPVTYSWYRGFYFNGNIIQKLRVNQKSDRNGKVIKWTEKVVFTKVNNEDVVKYFSLDTLLKECKFKVKDYKKSGKLFGFSEVKKSVLDQLVKISKIELQQEVKKSKELENSVYVKVGEKQLRFSLDDIEIIYPNINGYTQSKDRDIKVGSEVLVVKNKSNRSLVIGDKKKVLNIIHLNNKRYIGFDNDNKGVEYSRINNFKLV